MLHCLLSAKTRSLLACNEVNLTVVTLSLIMAFLTFVKILLYSLPVSEILNLARAEISLRIQRYSETIRSAFNVHFPECFNNISKNCVLCCMSNHRYPSLRLSLLYRALLLKAQSPAIHLIRTLLISF